MKTNQYSSQYVHKCFRESLLVFALLLIVVAAQGQVYKVLYTFGTNPIDPQSPEFGSLVQAGDGNLYGTAAFGGELGAGAVFKLTPAGTLSLLYSFTGVGGDGAYGGLSLGRDGNLYGTTWSGMIFRLTLDGQFTLLHTLTSDEGENPIGPPIQTIDSVLYGTATAGGAGSFGTVYKLTQSGDLIVLHSFIRKDGSAPNAPLLEASDGNLYGTTSDGGKGWRGTA